MMHLTELCDLLRPVFHSRTTGEWLALLVAAGVPAGPVASIGEMLAHPQALAREMVVEVSHSRLGTMKSLGSPVKLSGSTRSSTGDGDGAPLAGSPRRTGGREPPPRRGAPRLGEHTREVLEEAGWAAAEVEGLIEKGAALAPS
jgi:crotonobetainyl-CoA:carnitine CoA-transferase CaiB-like acyl-CoA transferase